MSSTKQQLLTAQDFWLLPESGKWRELVRGEVIKKVSPGFQHGRIAMKIGTLLNIWAMAGKKGFIVGEVGYILERGPDTVRLPDVAFVRADRLAGEDPIAFVEFAPDLAVEVISPSETGNQIQEKVFEYLRAGTPLVWTVYPRTRTVVAHTPEGIARTFGENDTLEFREVLPGFRCIVREFFE